MFNLKLLHIFALIYIDMVVELKVIYGGAGCGKTHRIVEIATELAKKQLSYIVLAPTHSSKYNVYHRFKSLGHDIDKDRFQTIYAYFCINWEDNDVIGPSVYYDVVFIDEFGLIKKELFRQMMSCLNTVKKHITVYIAGDVLQLSPIYVDKLLISLHRLNKYYERVPSFIIEHDYKSLFSLKFVREASKELLTVNHRSDSDTLGLIHEIFYDLNISRIKPISTNKVVYLLSKENYTFISAKYEQHDLIYRQLKTQITDKTEINGLAFYKGAKFMAIENTRQVHNGDLLKFKRIEGSRVIFKRDDEEILWNNNFKLIPAQLLTSHKAQGLSIDKVIVCIDDMFDISMFYTMCTRAISSLMFYTAKKTLDTEGLMRTLTRFHEMLVYYGYSIDMNKTDSE